MKNLNWILKASILGFAFFISVLLIKPIGVSTQFSVLSGMVHNVVDPNVIEEDLSRDSGYRSTNAYYDKSEGKLAKSIVNPLNYDFIFVLAIPLGAVLGYVLSKKKSSATKTEHSSNVQNKENEPKEGFLKAYLPSFLAGALILFGARMADGCTSGHMMSGIMQSSVSGFFFMISVFAVAIPTSIIKEKLAIRKGI